eukprot:3819901-Pleurochrysis_carterae.AAC.2
MASAPLERPYMAADSRLMLQLLPLKADGVDSPKCVSLLLDGAFWTAVLTTANAALGAGVLAYPFAFRNAGGSGENVGDSLS